MSFITGWTEVVQSARTSLMQNTIINDPENYMRPTGMLDYLLNPVLNPRTIDAIQVQNANSSLYRDVQIRYRPHRGDTNVITSDASLTCTKVDQERDLLQTVQPTLFVSDKFSIDEDYVRENNELGMDKDERLAKGLRDIMRTCRENISSQVLSKEAGLFGANPSQGTGVGSYVSFQGINSNGGVDVANFDLLINDQEQNYMSGPLGIVGFGGNVTKYFNRLAVGNLNTNAGVDIASVAQQFGALYFKDYSTAANLSSNNNMLVFYPGMAQFYSYNLNRGDFQFRDRGDVIVKGVMPDPVYPQINWDFDIAYDRQCTENGGRQGAYTVRVWLYFDVWNVPEGAFGDTYGDLNDFNGVLGYSVTSA